MFPHCCQYVLSIGPGLLDGFAVVAHPRIISRRFAAIHELGMLHLAAYTFVELRQGLACYELVCQFHVIRL